jgi:DNA polymerase-3 subunit alpha
MIEFAHLHVHTGYSLADSLLKPKQLAKRIKELGMKSVAITDHGNLFGVIEFYKACKSEGIKPIIGIETYVAPRTNRQKEGDQDSKNYHLILLAKNEKGYSNLMQLSSNASLEGMYYRPRTDDNNLRKYSEGLICLSACIAGKVQKLILNGHRREAKETALFYESIFGKGNFYLELQNHGMSEQTIVNNELLEISKETGIPLVCTNDCHYLDKKDYQAHDVLMAVQAKTTIGDTKRKSYSSDQFYLKSPQEMYKLFGHIPSAIENTVRIADQCNVEIEFGKSKLPKFCTPEGITNYDYLKKLVYEGAEKLYPQITQDIVDRIEYELSTVKSMGYIDYFLIVWDFIRYAKENGVLVGPGRGSAAGSIVTYCLFITRIDPLKYDLLFERELQIALVKFR